MAKLTKEEKAALKRKKKEEGKGLWNEFKTFINRGNAFMLAVGVVIGGAFSAIVNAFVGMLTSLATWPVPGGLKGLITVLPAVTDAQKGATFLGQAGEYTLQAFEKSEVNQKVIEYAAASGRFDLTVDDLDFIQWKSSLLSEYVLHGTKYTSVNSAIVDWGILINAVISFLIIAIVLFVIVKVVNTAAAKKAEAEAKARERYYEKHPEERPVPPEPGIPEPTEKELLASILVELKKSNGEKPEAKK